MVSIGHRRRHRLHNAVIESNSSGKISSCFTKKKRREHVSAVLDANRSVNNATPEVKRNKKKVNGTSRFFLKQTA